MPRTKALPYRQRDLHIAATRMLGFRPKVLEQHEETKRDVRRAVERNWRTWLRNLFPENLRDTAGTPTKFAPFHGELWHWVWNLERGDRPLPFIACWFRGSAKSTSAEMAAAMVACRGQRSYGLYVSRTQDQADKHVESAAALFESNTLADLYPLSGQRAVGKYGASRGWRRSRLRTAGGFTLDAIGFDTAARGLKVENRRPDFLIIDDIDSEGDSPDIIKGLVETLTQKLLPVGSDDCAVLFIQNKVSDDGLMGQLIDGKADYLTDSIISGPIPGAHDLQWEARPRTDGRPGIRYHVISGAPTWASHGLDKLERQMNTFGRRGFMVEVQHETEPPPGGLYDHIEFDPITIHLDAVPWRLIVGVEVWCDPAVTDTDQSDSNGVQVDAIDANGVVYRLFSWEQRATADITLRMAYRQAIIWRADAVGIETNQGGDLWYTQADATWKALIADDTVPEIHGPIPFNPATGEQAIPATPRPRLRQAKAGRDTGGKVARQTQMVDDYDKGMVKHVIGTVHVLERAQRRFPLKKPLDLADAAYWSWRSLTRQHRSRSGLTAAAFPSVPKSSGWGEAESGRADRLSLPDTRIPRGM